MGDGAYASVWVDGAGCVGFPVRYDADLAKAGAVGHGLLVSGGLRALDGRGKGECKGF